MTAFTSYVKAENADAVSRALCAEGWNVTAAALRRDGYLVNHIDADELDDAARAAKEAVVSATAETVEDYDAEMVGER